MQSDRHRHRHRHRHRQGQRRCRNIYESRSCLFFTVCKDYNSNIDYTMSLGEELVWQLTCHCVKTLQCVFLICICKCDSSLNWSDCVTSVHTVTLWRGDMSLHTVTLWQCTPTVTQRHCDEVSRHCIQWHCDGSINRTVGIWHSFYHCCMHYNTVTPTDRSILWRHTSYLVYLFQRDI